VKQKIKQGGEKMPQCKSCKRSGLFLKLEKDTGLCLSCAAEFAAAGKELTAKITQSKNRIAATSDPVTIKKEAANIVANVERLLELEKRFQIEPGQELLDLKRTYERMKEKER